MLLGLIADTHGYLGDDVLQALAGCDRILHAGDVGEGVLPRLGALAPLTAVRGNNDLAGPAAHLPEVARLDLAGRRIIVVHRLADAPREPWDVLVFGHCHKQHADHESGRLYLNPGAAGRRGFHRSRSVALLHLEPAVERVEFIDLGQRNPLAAAASGPGRMVGVRG